MGQRGESVKRPRPRVTPSNAGPHPARPTLGSQLPRFSSRREEREGERRGCAWLLLALLPSAGPFPSRQETSPGSQPAAGLSAPPPTSLPRAYGVILYPAAGLALQLRPDYSALAPKAWHILALLRSTGPSSGSPASSLAPPR